MQRSLAWVVAIALTVLAPTSFAQIHKCKSPDGRYHYSDTACAVNTKGQQIKLQDNTI